MPIDTYYRKFFFSMRFAAHERAIATTAASFYCIPKTNTEQLRLKKETEAKPLQKRRVALITNLMYQ